MHAALAPVASVALAVGPSFCTIAVRQALPDFACVLHAVFRLYNGILTDQLLSGFQIVSQDFQVSFTIRTQNFW